MNPALAYEKVEEVYKNLFIARTALRKTMIMFLGIQYLFQLDDDHDYLTKGNKRVIDTLDILEEVFVYIKSEAERLGGLRESMDDPDKVLFLIDGRKSLNGPDNKRR